MASYKETIEKHRRIMDGLIILSMYVDIDDSSSVDIRDDQISARVDVLVPREHRTTMIELGWLENNCGWRFQL